MKKTKFAAVIAFLYSLVGIKELPKDDSGKLAFTPEQDEKIKEGFGEKYEAALKAAQEVLDEEQGLDAQKQSALDALATAVGVDNENKPTPENPAPVITAATQKIQEQQQQIEAMANAPEPDEVMQKFQKGAKSFGIAAMIAMTTPTALFGMETNKEFSTDRPWNKRASLELSNRVAAETDFTDTSTIARLNDDLKEYYVRNPQVLRDLRKDRFGLPSFWPKQFGVVDQISDAVVDVANVTQARKPEWSPNPDLFIDAEKRKIYPVQIDVQFTGYQLQKFETSWINALYDMDGSSPYKLSFVAFLVRKIDEQARLEDRISSINGVYVFKPSGIKAKGSYLNRQNGLRYQLYKFRDLDKKIKAFKSSLGKITDANTFDYINEFVDWLPNEIRMALGMKIYVSQKRLNAYQTGYKLANQLNNDYQGNDLNYVDGYSNLQFVVLTDLEGSDIFFMTDDQNIEILEDVPNEKAIYKMELLKRDTFIHADYKLGCAFVFAGFKLPENSNFLGQAQFIWCNDAPLFNDNFYVPMYGAPIGNAVEVTFNRIKTDKDLLGHVQTINSDMPIGHIIKIKGDVNQKTNSLIKNISGGVGNLTLTADFDPKTGGTLTLLKTATGWKEVSRTSAPEVASSKAVQFSTTSIDSKLGSEFVYKGTSSVVLADIINGVEGAEVKIYGQATNTLTVDNVGGNIIVTGGSQAVLNTAAKYIVLKKFDGIWVETSRG